MGFFWKGGWKCQFYFYGRGVSESGQINLLLRILPFSLEKYSENKRGKRANAQKRFRLPDFALHRVKIRSKSRPNQVQEEGFGGGRVQRGRSGWEGSVDPLESLYPSRPTDTYKS